jgi:hypothetical protein
MGLHPLHPRSIGKKGWMYSGGVKDLEKLAVRRKIGPKEGKMSIGIFFCLW